MDILYIFLENYNILKNMLAIFITLLSLFIFGLLITVFSLVAVYKIEKNNQIFFDDDLNKKDK